MKDQTKRTLEDVIAELGLPDDARMTVLEVPEKITPKDIYSLVVFSILTPYILCLYLAIAVYLFFARLPWLVYVRYLRSRGIYTRIPTSIDFYVFSTFESVLMLPVVVTAFLHVVAIHLIAMVLFAPIGLVTGVNFKNNISVIRGVGAYGTGAQWTMSPSRTFELWRCMYGMYYRQSFWQWTWASSWMTIVNPVLKYFFTTNIWLWDLEEKWCNQWTTKFETDRRTSRESILGLFTQFISHSFLSDEMTRQEIDNACFCAHYPMPPPGCTASCLGIQYAPLKLSVRNLRRKPLLIQRLGITLTKHWYLEDKTPHVPLSETGINAIYEVNLSYFNAWHFMTGYVEVNFQHESGGIRIEHPMWMIMPKNGYLGNQLYDSVNNLFGEFVVELHTSILRSITKGCFLFFFLWIFLFGNVQLLAASSSASIVPTLNEALPFEDLFNIEAHLLCPK